MAADTITAILDQMQARCEAQPEALRLLAALRLALSDDSTLAEIEAALKGESDARVP